MQTVIKNRIRESIDVKETILTSDELVSAIEKAVEEVKNTLKNGGKIILCGNGGSASDAAHIAGELVGRFQKERVSIPAIALNEINVSLTAIANDYSYDDVFARPVSGLMKEGDVLIGISTSGNSENVYRAIKMAKEKGGKTIGLLGKSGGKITECCDVSIIIPSNVTARIQESHIMIGHIICELAEQDY